MGPEYEEGKRYLITFTGRNWEGQPRYESPQPAVFLVDDDAPRFYFESDSLTHIGTNPMGGYEYEVTPIDESTPTEIHYLYPDGDLFSLFSKSHDGNYTFTHEQMKDFLDKIGLKPAPKKYEDGLYVDKDGDEVMWRNGRLWTSWETEPGEYLDIYGPLTRKDDQ